MQKEEKVIEGSPVANEIPRINVPETEEFDLQKQEMELNILQNKRLEMANRELIAILEKYKLDLQVQHNIVLVPRK